MKRNYIGLKNKVATILKIKKIRGLDADGYLHRLQKLSDRVIAPEKADHAAKIFSALADPARIRILKLLEKESMCICDLTLTFGLRQPLISYHLKILKESGLVKPIKKGKWVFYEIADKKLVRLISRITETIKNYRNV